MNMLSFESFGSREREYTRYMESQAYDQTVTLRYRVSLEGFVNVAQLQRNREAHWASFSPPAVCVCEMEGGAQCGGACIYIQYSCSVSSSVFSWFVCVLYVKAV